MRSVLLVGGGSIGHLAPCVAVREALLKRSPAVSALLVCSDRAEDAAYLALEGIVPETLPLPRRSPAFLLRLSRGFARAREILRRESPDAVFSKGGAVSIPLCIAAWRRGIPVILHESDARPGLASRFLARIADAVCLGFPEARSRIRSEHLSVTGNPVRERMTAGSRAEGLRILGFGGRKPVLLILGGSQGALDLNRAVGGLPPELLASFDVCHITGRGKAENLRARPGYVLREFASAELPHFYAAATVAVSRAGAGTIAELAANGVPAVLVPLRGVARDHQLENARCAAARGGCAVLVERELPLRLRPALDEILRDHRARSLRIRALAVGSAARGIADIIATEILRRGKRKRSSGSGN